MKKVAIFLFVAILPIAVTGCSKFRKKNNCQVEHGPVYYENSACDACGTPHVMSDSTYVPPTTTEVLPGPSA